MTYLKDGIADCFIDYSALPIEERYKLLIEILKRIKESTVINADNIREFASNVLCKLKE